MLRFLLAFFILTFSAPVFASEPPPRFVAVGYGLRRLVSDDGITWRNEQIDPDPSHAESKDFLLRGVAYGKGTIVAVGGSNTSRILVSTDSKTWKDHSVKANFLGDVAFGNDRFVAVGYQRAMTSKNGTEWSAPIPLRDASWRRIVFGNGRFVATGLPSSKDPESGCVTTSTDGEKWTSTIVAGKAMPHDIAFGNGRFVIVGSQGLRETSKDGVTWENRVLGEKSDLLNNVIWTGAEFIASGNGQGVYTSADGITWKKADMRFPSRVAFANGIFAGCSTGKMSYSKDGREWKLSKTESMLQITKILAIETP